MWLKEIKDVGVTPKLAQVERRGMAAAPTPPKIFTGSEPHSPLGPVV